MIIFNLIDFHLMRTNGELKKKWLQFCGVSKENLKVSHRLCSDHFSGDDLIWRANKVYIKQNKVVPCKYISKS